MTSRDRISAAPDFPALMAEQALETPPVDRNDRPNMPRPARSLTSELQRVMPMPVVPETKADGVITMASATASATSVSKKAAQEKAPKDVKRPPEHPTAAGPSKAPPKVTEQTPPGDDREPSPYVIASLVVLATTVGLMLAVLVAFIISRFSSARIRRPTGLEHVPNLSTPCTGPTGVVPCENYTAYMLAAMNPDAAPCVDFYEHVCGRWRNPSAIRPPYGQEHVTLFNNRVGDALLRRGNHLGTNTSLHPESLEGQMTLFYASCFDVASGLRPREDVTAVLQAIGTDPRQWLEVRAFGVLLELVVSTALESGLASFLRVQFSRARVAFRVEVGETLSSSLLNFNIRRTNFTRDTLQELKAKYSFASFSEVTYLRLLVVDDLAKKLRAAAKDQGLPAARGIHELTDLARDVKWRDVLERGILPGLKAETKSSEFEVHGAGVIRSIIEELRQKPLHLASVYALMVLLSQLMRYMPTPGQGPEIASRCLQATAEHFDSLYPLWVARNLQNREMVAGARVVFDDITSTIRGDRKVNDGLLIDTRRLNRARLVFYDEWANETLPTAPIAADLGLGFVANLAALSAAKVGYERVPSEDGIVQQKGHLGYRKDGSFLISTAYVSSTGIYGFHHDRSVQAATMYAALGTAILRVIFDSDAVYFPSWARAHTDSCYARSASSVLGRPVDVRLAKPLMGFRWSTQLAYYLKTRALTRDVTGGQKQAAEAATTGESADSADPFFFFMLCFAHCGEQHGSQLCNDLAGTHPQFAEAYDCPKRTSERSGRCDCYGLNHCATHLPVAEPPTRA